MTDRRPRAPAGATLRRTARIAFQPGFGSWTEVVQAETEHWRGFPDRLPQLREQFRMVSRRSAESRLPTTRWCHAASSTAVSANPCSRWFARRRVAGSRPAALSALLDVADWQFSGDAAWRRHSKRKEPPRCGGPGSRDPGVTGRYSNQLNYHSGGSRCRRICFRPRRRTWRPLRDSNPVITVKGGVPRASRRWDFADSAVPRSNGC